MDQNPNYYMKERKAKIMTNEKLQPVGLFGIFAWKMIVMIYQFTKPVQIIFLSIH